MSGDKSQESRVKSQESRDNIQNIVYSIQQTVNLTILGKRVDNLEMC